MRSSDEALLNRYLDHDLTPPEAMEFDRKLSNDQALRNRLNEYRQVRQAVAELPAAQIPEDMVERLIPLFEEPASGISLWAKLLVANTSRWAAGAAALILFSTGVYIYSEYDTSKQNSFVNQTVHNSENLPSPTTSPSTESPINQKIVNTNIQPPVETKPPLAIVANPVGNDQARSVSTSGKNPDVEPEISQLIEMLDKVDRRHFLQVQVDSANERVVSRIIRILEKYRTKPAQLAVLNQDEESDEPPSIDIVAVVPTGMMKKLSLELEEIFGGKVESHKPDDAFRNDELANRLATIPPEILSRAGNERCTSPAQRFSRREKKWRNSKKQS